MRHFVRLLPSLPAAPLTKPFSTHPSILKIPLNYSKTDNRKDFEFKHVSEEDIFSIVLKLNNKKQTSGNIPTKILKCVAHICNKQLAECINYCIDTNTFPDMLKLAEIKPLHKKGDKTNKEN